MRLALQIPNFTYPDVMPVEERVIGQGLAGVTVNIPSGGHHPEVVARAGEVLAKAMP